MRSESTTNISVEVDEGRCGLDGVLDFNTTRAALDSLRPVIEQQAKVEIDFGSVSNANSAGLALLIECQALAHMHQHEVQFSNIPDGLLQLAVVCEVKGLI